MMATPLARDYSILIADDESNCRQALRDILEPVGYRTLLASSGEEALDIVRAADVHLVLLDMHMPTLTGLETWQMVRQMLRFAREPALATTSILPAILVTGDADENLIRQACQMRFYSVIPKPISKNVVLYTVLRALSCVYGKH